MAVEILSDEHIAEVDQAIDKFESEVAGLPNMAEKFDAPVYLSMNISDLKKKTEVELAEALFELSKYLIHVQRVINYNKSWERWGKAKLDEVAASILPSLDTNYGYNERELMARHNHKVCKKINSFLRKIKMELDRLYGIPEGIKTMMGAINSIKFAIIHTEK